MNHKILYHLKSHDGIQCPTFVLKWQKYFCQQWLLVPCCVQCWSLANPHAAAQHAGESTKVNVFWVVSSHKVLSYHRIGNYRHSHHDVMEVLMMSHVGQEGRITFFFKQNCHLSYFCQRGWISQQSCPTEIKWQTGRPTVDTQAPQTNLIRFFNGDNLRDILCTRCLRILICPISAMWVAVNQKIHKWCPVFGMRMITIFVCHRWWSLWNPVKDEEDSQISSVHLWILLGSVTGLVPCLATSFMSGNDRARCLWSMIGTV